MELVRDHEKGRKEEALANKAKREEEGKEDKREVSGEGGEEGELVGKEGELLGKEVEGKEENNVTQ